MRMREMPAVTIPPGASVILKPGGTHIMIIGLTRQLKAGQNFPLTLGFERAGKVDLRVPVFSAGAMGDGEMEHMQHQGREGRVRGDGFAPAEVDLAVPHRDFSHSLKKLGKHAEVQARYGSCPTSNETSAKSRRPEIDEADAVQFMMGDWVWISACSSLIPVIPIFRVDSVIAANSQSANIG